VKGSEYTEKHEKTHVYVHYYKAYAAFKGDAESYEGICMRKEKAECFAKVINSEMRDLYRLLASVDSAAFDCAEYGSEDMGIVCERAKRLRGEYVRALAILEAARKRCAELPDFPN